MSYHLIVKPQAEINLDKALEQYLEQNENFSLKWVNTIKKSLRKNLEHPEHYQKRYNGIRIIFSEKFP